MVKKNASSRNENAMLLLILAAGCMVISIFFIGMGLPESLRIAQISSRLSQPIRDVLLGSFEIDLVDHVLGNWAALRSEVGVLEIARALPVAFVYLLGGVNDFSSLFIPVLATLINAALLYAIGRRFYGVGAGWIAALLWLTLPTTVFSASTLLNAQITVAFFLVGAFLHLRILSKPIDKVSAFLIALTFLVLSIWSFVAAFSLFFLTSVSRVTQRLKRPSVWILASIAVILVLIIAGIDPDEIFVDFYTNLVRLAEMEVLLLTFLIFLTVTIEKRDKKNDFVLRLAGVSFVGALLNFAFSSNNDLATNPMFVLLLGSVSLMAAAHLSSFFKEIEMRKLILAFAGTTVFIAWLAVQGQRQLVSNLDGINLISASTIMPLLQIVPGMLLIVLVISVYLGAKSKKHPVVGGLALFLILLSLIPFSWEQQLRYQPTFLAAKAAGELISTADLDLPVYILNDTRLAEQLRYIYPAMRPIRVIEHDQIEAIQNGYLLYWEGETKSLENWWKMGLFGRLGYPRLRVNRILSAENAAIHLAATRGMIELEAGSHSYFALYGAEINANALCEAYTSWMKSQLSGLAGPPYVAIDGNSILNCFAIGKSLLAEITSLNYATAYSSYIRLQQESEDGIENPILVIRKKATFYLDPRIFDLQLALEPNSFYLFETTLRAQSPIMSLYFKINQAENYADYTSYPEWTTIAILISTHGEPESPLLATFSPVLFYPNGEAVYLQSIQVAEIRAK